MACKGCILQCLQRTHLFIRPGRYNSLLNTNDRAYTVIPSRPKSLHATLLTGATGFIGHYVLAQLLERGERCTVLLRGPVAKSVARLQALIEPLGIDLEQQVARGRLSFVEGELGAGRPPELSGKSVQRIVHCAGLTRLDDADPQQTRRVNYQGALELLRVAEQHAVRELHLVSTAYRCGRTAQTAYEDDAVPVSFNNPYERSKWDAECAWRVWARQNRATVTVYRPSIVVGDRKAGRVTRLAGVYLVARAVKMLADAAEGDPAIAERRVSVALAGRPDCMQNLVPVDYVAQMIAHAVADPRWHGRHYHLTHPSPPSNAQVKQAIEQAFSLFGGYWSGDGPVSETQRSFEQATAALRPYLEHQPRFDRREADELERAAGLACPRYSERELIDLFRAADRAGWGKRRGAPAPVRESLDDYDHYFFRFLPERLSASRVAQATAASCVMRFVLTDLAGADWTCRFVRGLLARAERTTPDQSPPADFTYQTTSELFWTALRGQADPQAVFLDGSAIVQGNLEQAMKMSVILREFNREFPCTRDQLAAVRRSRQEAIAC